MNDITVNKRANVTYALIAACSIVLILESLVGTSLRSGFEMFYIESSSFRPVQLLSHLFIHGGLMHLLLNMLGLWIFGSAIERAIGAWKFLLFYVIAGLGAGCIYQLISYYQFNDGVAPLLASGVSYNEMVNVFSSYKYFTQFPNTEQASIIFATPVVGASGALYGILAAFMYLFPNHKMIFLFLPFPIAAKFFVPVLLLIDLVSGMTGFSLFGSNIAHAAHIGGAITGFVVVWVFARRVNV